MDLKDLSERPFLIRKFNIQEAICIVLSFHKNKNSFLIFVFVYSYEVLGLSAMPNKGDNGVHASASPFEGLAEKCNWLGISIGKDKFGRALLKAGLSEQRIKDWSVDPRVNIAEGEEGSVFDALEDMDVNDCLQKLVELNKLNN